MNSAARRYFNTSGPNVPVEHYTLQREDLLSKGLDLVRNNRYFTIWAPRQTGKTTYFLMLADLLKAQGYQVLHINVENFSQSTSESFLQFLANELEEAFDIEVNATTFSECYDQIKRQTGKKWVLIVDEIEGLNSEVLGQFLHTIRNLYHFRANHNFKAVILVGVSNITGVIEDHASPFNIADNFEVPYFTNEETLQLLGMHEQETGQKFAPGVKEKISSITGNQPGLVNGFAYRLVEQNPGKQVIEYDDYLTVENWYLNIAIDKNISNIINKAKKHRTFVESLLFSETPVKFSINDERIKHLAAFGVIKSDDDGFVCFDVPLYKKALFDAFYPYSNGESDRFFRHLDTGSLVSPEGDIDFSRLIDNYKTYVKKRSFRHFREKDPETGEYKNLREAALAYSFETYIQSFLQEVGGKSYLEPHTGLGKCDLLVNIRNREYVIEFRIYRTPAQFNNGKRQLAHYAASLDIQQGIYLVFVPNTVSLPSVKEGREPIDNIDIHTFIVPFDEEKDF